VTFDYTIILIMLFCIALGLGVIFIFLFFLVRHRAKRGDARRTTASELSPDEKVG
jgi:heme/copper-type cytochrome/quinol oxidase subunit 2